MTANIIIVVAAIFFAAHLFSKRLMGDSEWQATLTPLASIIGSGFLVSLPLLAGELGTNAVFGMAALIVIAYLVGGAIRFNIRFY